MKLHEDNERFKYLIEKTSEYIGYPDEVICKDYFVMLILKEIVKREPFIIFKGGTSLSKAWHVIDRFSEDIDLTYPEKIGESKRHNINKKITKIIEELGFIDISERKFNKNEFRKFIVEYPKLNNEETFFKKDVIIEAAFQIKSYPIEVKKVESYIAEYLKSIGKEDLIIEYELEEFNVNVQSLERTFIDKVFAICDYKIDNKIKWHARHIYDLYKLYPYIKFDDNFKVLVDEIRALRKNNEKCFSAQPGENINSHLNEIIEKMTYKEDYENSLENYFKNCENVSYAEAVTVIEKIMESNMFI